MLFLVHEADYFKTQYQTDVYWPTTKTCYHNAVDKKQ